MRRVVRAHLGYGKRRENKRKENKIRSCMAIVKKARSFK